MKEQRKKITRRNLRRKRKALIKDGIAQPEVTEHKHYLNSIKTYTW